MRAIALFYASLATTDARRLTPQELTRINSHDVVDLSPNSQPSDDVESSDPEALATSKLPLAAFHLALSSSKLGWQKKARLVSHTPFARPQPPRRIHNMMSAASDDEIMELEMRLDQMKKERLRAEEEARSHEDEARSNEDEDQLKMKEPRDHLHAPMKEEEIVYAKWKLNEIARETKDLYLRSSPDMNQSAYLEKKAALKGKWGELERITDLPNFREWYKRREAQNDINGAPPGLFGTAGAVYELVYLKREIRNLNKDIKTLTRKREETPDWHWARKKRNTRGYKQQIELLEREVKTKEEEKIHVEDWLINALDDVFKFFSDGLDDTSFLRERMQLESFYDNHVQDRFEKTVSGKIVEDEAS